MVILPERHTLDGVLCDLGQGHLGRDTRMSLRRAALHAEISHVRRGLAHQHALLLSWCPERAWRVISRPRSSHGMAASNGLGVIARWRTGRLYFFPKAVASAPQAKSWLRRSMEGVAPRADAGSRSAAQRRLDRELRALRRGLTKQLEGKARRAGVSSPKSLNVKARRTEL